MYILLIYFSDLGNILDIFYTVNKSFGSSSQFGRQKGVTI